MRIVFLVLSLSVVLSLSACSSSGGVQDVPVEDRNGEQVDNQQNNGLSQEEIDAQAAAEAERKAQAEGQSVEQSDPLAVEEAWKDPENPIYQRVIYFDYDSNNVREEYRATLDAHAEYLRRRPNLLATLEGHTDERGSREYNIALGERRAQSLKRAMVVRGVLPEQIRTVSFGEEKPDATGNNEAAWEKNRRVEIVYGD